MFTSIVSLVQSHHDDFWLNVIAGVPFLVFDIAIITLLLPITMRWWDERAWRETRLTAVQRLLAVYGNPLPRERHDGAANDPLQVLDRLSDGSRDTFARESLLTLSRKLHAHSARIDTELQSALHVLDAPIAKDVLTLHYLVKDLIDRTLEAALACSERLERDYRQDADTTAFPGFDLTNLTSVRTKIEAQSIAAGCAIQRLAVIYAPGPAELDLIRRSKPTMQIDACVKLCAVAAYLDRSIGYAEARPFGINEANAIFGAMVAQIAAHPPVTLYGAGLIDRLSGRGRSGLAA